MCRPENRTVPPTTTLSPNMSLSAKFSSVMADMKAKASAAVAAVRVDRLSDRHATTPGFWENPEASRQALRGHCPLSPTDPMRPPVGVLERSNLEERELAARAGLNANAVRKDAAWLGIQRRRYVVRDFDGGRAGL